MTTYGNPAGLGILEKLRKLEDKLEKMDERAKTTSLSGGCRKIRHRYIEVYKRDILGIIDREGRKKLDEGSIAAHGGDAIADADLYTSGERNDEDVLIDIYGLNSDQISSLCKCRTS